MKILNYATGSKFGFQILHTKEARSEHMKFLHKEKAPFTPFLLIEGWPGADKPVWKSDAEYKKMLKKEVDEAC